MLPKSGIFSFLSCLTQTCFLHFWKRFRLMYPRTAILFSVARQVRMAAALPAGLLERMICLTESLLDSLGDKKVSSSFAPFSGDEINHEEKAIMFEGSSGQTKSPATTVFTSLAPADISSSASMGLNKNSGGSCSAGGAKLNTSNGSSFREIMDLKKKSLIEKDNINRKRPDCLQVKVQ
jgi:hypothetical protein